MNALRILVVDDDKDAADSLAKLVGLSGHDSRATYDGASALRLAEEYQPDVVMADLAMPGVNGLTLAKSLSSRPSPPHLVAISGYVDGPHRRQATKAGFNNFLPKPFGDADLRRVLETARRALQLRQEAERNHRLVQQVQSNVADLGKEVERRRGIASDRDRSASEVVPPSSENVAAFIACARHPGLLPARIAHLQIRAWLQSNAGVVGSEVVQRDGKEVFVIRYRGSIALKDRDTILDRLVGYTVAFEPVSAL